MYMNIRMHLRIRPRSKADPSFVGHEAYTILGALFNKKDTKLAMKVSIYLE